MVVSKAREPRVRWAVWVAWMVIGGIVTSLTLVFGWWAAVMTACAFGGAFLWLDHVMDAPWREQRPRRNRSGR
jgi:fatty acid desaturase